MSNPTFVMKKVGEFAFEDRPAPKLENDTDVIVQIKATGICGSDVHYWTHGAIGDFVVKSPLVLGHESAGVVVETGSKVTALKKGDRVCLEPGRPCKSCSECLKGKYNLCPDMRFAATPPIDGTLTKYYVMDQSFCYKLPDWASFEDGALMEPLAVAVHSVKLAQVQPGSSLVVFGAGPVGLLIAVVAKQGYGAGKVVLVDINQERLDFVQKQFPGVEVSNSKGKGAEPRDVAKALVAEAGLQSVRGFEAAIDATGALPCIHAAIFSVKPGGHYVQTGMGADTIQFPIGALGAGELTVKGCFRYNWGDFAQAVDFLSRKIIDVKPLVTFTVPFEKAEEAFHHSKNGLGIKSIIYGPE